LSCINPDIPVDEAFKVFKSNYDRYPNQYTTNAGIERAYSSKGNYKKGLTHIEAALPQVRDEERKNNFGK